MDVHDYPHEPLGYQMTDPQMWWDVVWNAGWRALLNQMPAEEQLEFEKGVECNTHRHPKFKNI